MRDLWVRPGGLHTLRLLQVLAVLTFLFVAVLASAPLRPYFAEWRRVQQAYNRSAASSGRTPIVPGLKQIWKPELGIADRCITCHLGMGGAAEPIPSEPLFAAHPAIPHDPRAFGCSVCHGGQGRATTTEAAHGFVSHWDEQMLDKRHVGAGCATCHDQFPTATRVALKDGGLRIEQLDCLACHRLDGRGRGDGPDLSYVAIKGFARDWYEKHLARHDEGRTDAWRSSFGPIAPPDLEAIDRLLVTRVGAPEVVEARALAMERGCLGCHKLGGIGGDEGPALDAVGRKPLGDLNLSHLSGPQTFVNYLREHLVDPARVFPGSTMLAQDYTPEELDLLTTWVLSLRARDLPTAFLPKDRVRRRVLGERQPERSAEENFGTFCAGCHGPRGEGRSAGNAEARFPAIGSADFLNVAPDDVVLATLRLGRPNRRMPAWGAVGNVLSDEAARDLVALLRRRLGPPPSLASLNRLTPESGLGVRVYHDDCAACHGDAGEGSALGPPLAATDRPLSFERAYEATVHGVAGTAMPAYADRPAASLAAVLRYVTGFSRPVPPPSSPLPQQTVTAVAAAVAQPGRAVSVTRATWTLGTGSADRGADLYQRNCAGCHGPNGEGRVGPGLANPGFQQAATAPYIAATIIRGRAGTPMPSFGRDSNVYSRLTGDDALDLTAFIRERLGTTAPRATGDN